MIGEALHNPQPRFLREKCTAQGLLHRLAEPAAGSCSTSNKIHGKKIKFQNEAFHGTALVRLTQTVKWICAWRLNPSSADSLLTSIKFLAAHDELHPNISIRHRGISRGRIEPPYFRTQV